MDHRDVVSDLPAATRQRLTARSTAAGLGHLAAHLGLVALLGGLIAARVPGWPLLLPVHGVVLTFLFTLEHECTHKTPFASEWLNEAAGRLAGGLLLLPFTWFRYFHLAHHRHTNIAGKDPELDTPRPETPGRWFWHVSGLPYWGAQIRLVLRLATGRECPAFLPARARPRAEAEARAMLALYALALGSLVFAPLVLWLWIVPALLGQPALRLYLLAEHGDCPRVENMLANTRTTFTNAVVRFLAWNMPYHTEHHVFPAVPFHRLPELHALMRERLRVTADGYAAFTKAYLDRRRG